VSFSGNFDFSQNSESIAGAMLNNRSQKRAAAGQELSDVPIGMVAERTDSRLAEFNHFRWSAI
jgi:hypothetical protein